MEPRHALTLHNSQPGSKLNADTLYSVLIKYNLFNAFADVVYSIRNGFNVGLPISVPYTRIARNHKSCLAQPAFISAYIEKEVSLGRMLGPFTEDQMHARLGDFFTSPLGLVPKAGEDGYRMIQDHSFPRDQSYSSVNSRIDHTEFPCEWGKLDDIIQMILSLPKTAQAATFDAKSAYRQVAVDPAQHTRSKTGGRVKRHDPRDVAGRDVASRSGSQFLETRLPQRMTIRDK